MSGWREKIYEIVETGNNSVASKIYDWTMLVFIVISIVPLAFREQTDCLLLESYPV